MSTVMTLATLSAALRLAVPVALTALGGLVSERAGVLNLGLEGMMISGALGGYLAANDTGSPWVGLLAGAATGAVVGVALALVVVQAKANQMVAGLGLTLFCTAATTYLFRTIFGLGTTPPRIERLDMPVLAALGLVVFAVVWFVLNRTTVGLALSAAGDSPVAVDALGYRVDRLRTGATVVGGSIAGLGGAVLVCGPLGLFLENVTHGRGWVALALVVFARWRPWAALGGALLFGLCDAVQIRLQGQATAVPYELFLALPYLITLAALVVRGRTSSAPLALGVPFRRSGT
jgi:general nucleoside transport system permease protein